MRLMYYELINPKKEDTQQNQEPEAQPWVEKYRPKTLDEVTAQDGTIDVLKNSLRKDNLPHMLFHGPPGTGKTSTVLALCRELFGPKHMEDRVLELNASDERGISVVRDKIKSFAKRSIFQGATNSETGQRIPSYKVIILDEADSMTKDAQGALRRTMEVYSNTTRFCLICNYVTRIIEPITSRCSKFRFQPLDKADTIARLEYICNSENVPVKENALESLVSVSHGDLRRAITTLQSVSRLVKPGESVTRELILDVSGEIPDAELDDLVSAITNVSSGSSEEHLQSIMSAVEDITHHGYSAQQVAAQLHDRIILDPKIDSHAKLQVGIILATLDKALVDGANEKLQLLSASCDLYQNFENKWVLSE